MVVPSRSSCISTKITPYDIMSTPTLSTPKDDYNFNIARSDISPEMLASLPVSDEWVSGSDFSESAYQIHLIRRLRSDSSTGWSALPVAYPVHDTKLYPEVLIEGSLALKLIMNVTSRGGKIYDELGSVF